jgi:monoamine oxidase
MSELSTPGVYDTVVVGAGAAGVGAGRRLAACGISFVVLEAQDRVGGRAHTITGRSGAGIDLGCGWLHSADRNPWVEIAQEEGLEIDRSRPAWERRLAGVNISQADAQAFSNALQAFEARLEAAAREPDRPAADLFDPADARFRPMLDVFSGAYNGAPFRDISVHDYAAYQPTDENWRLPSGYGALVARAAAELPIRLNSAVRRVDRSGSTMRLIMGEEEILARTLVVAVPTTVLAEERLAFDPPIPPMIEAAAALPLGHVNKCFLALDEPELFPADHMVTGRTDTADTGSYTLRPFGRAMIEGFFGGEVAQVLEGEGRGALCAFAAEELSSLFGSEFRRRLRPLAESAWSSDPYIRGAYSHARPGCAWARAALRRPVEGSIFFAGEACSPHAFSTAHGAYETGVEAADAVIRTLGVSPSRA